MITYKNDLFDYLLLCAESLCTDRDMRVENACIDNGRIVVSQVYKDGTWGVYAGVLDESKIGFKPYRPWLHVAIQRLLIRSETITWTDYDCMHMMYRQYKWFNQRGITDRNSLTHALVHQYALNNMSFTACSR